MGGPGPAVTVLIDTYNHERFIEQAIVSVREQDFPAEDMEIIVVDDGSTDRTPDIVAKFAPDVRYLRKENGGQASAFNLGIRHSQGGIVAFLDGDDWWKPTKLHDVMETFEKNPWVGVVGHGIVQVENATGKASALAPRFPGSFDVRSRKGAETFRNYMCFLGTSRVSIRRSVLDKVLPIPEPIVVEADEFMSAVSIAHSSAVLLPGCLTHYRLHDDNQYQFREEDPVRMRRKLDALRSLTRELPKRLLATGIPKECIGIILDPILVTVGRMKLQLEGGMSWDTYIVEQDNFRLAYSQSPLGYRVYKQISLLLALFMPPRVYYKMKTMYTNKNIRRFRGFLGEPSPTAQIEETTLSTGESAPYPPNAARRTG